MAILADRKIIFREKALKHASTTNQLDQLVSIVPARSWVILLVLLALMIALVVWGFLGRIPFRVSGEGLLLAKNGSVYAAVAVAEPGRIKEILVKPSMFVKKGQLLAVLQESELENQVHTSQVHLQELEKRHQDLSELFESQIAQRTANIKAKNASLEKGLAAEVKSLQELKELFKMVEQAYKRQLEPKRFLTDTASNYYAQQAKVESMRQTIVENNISLSHFIDQKQEQLRDLDFRIRDKRHELNQLVNRLTLSERVISPVAGVITAISKNIGDLVKKGEAVARIANVGIGLDAIIFLSSKDGKKVKPGMSALVSPANVKKEEYGSMRAMVSTVSDYPVTQEAMMAILHNKKLVDELSKNSAPIAVRVQLQDDKETVSGFSWSSSQGPDEKITPGTAVVARITVNEKPPLRVVIPLLKSFWSTEK